MKRAVVIVGTIAAFVIAVKVVVGNAYGVSPWQVQVFPSAGDQGFAKP